MTTKVAEVMTPRVVAARENAQFADIVAIMRANRISALPVIDSQDRVIGVVSEADLLVKEAQAAPQRAGWRWLLPATERKAKAALAKDLMTHPAVTIGRDATVAEAASLMTARKVKRLPVVDPARHLVGIISRIDVLSVFGRADHEIRDEIVNTIISGAMALDPGVFEVLVGSGIVTITGQAESKTVAARLLDAIRHVEGVVDVRDRLSYPHDDPDDRVKHFTFSTFPPRG